MSSSIEDQIKAIEDEIFNTQKNKATEHNIGKLKAKIARLRNEQEKRRSSGGKGKGFAVKKSGDATVGIICFPSIGKSTLLNRLTAASSKIGTYDFTTLDVVPGVMKYKGASIQLLDLPGLIVGASKGKGRGKEILSAIRNVDLLLLMVDVDHLDHLDMITQELHTAGLRLNQMRPDVVVTPSSQGGITITSTVQLSHIDMQMIKGIASEFLVNGTIVIRDDITEDQLIDVFSDNREYLPAFVVVNKIDMKHSHELNSITQTIKNQGWEVVTISAKTSQALGQLQEAIFSHLQLIRVYMKPMGKDPDFNEPLILRIGDTVSDACRQLHRDFIDQFRYAQIWGPSAKHKGQKVGLDHRLQDTDILSVILTR